MPRRFLLLALVPFLLLVALAWEGIDFGYHWDEDHNKINAVVFSLEHDCTLLPDGYTYPGVNYWLTVGALTPEIIRAVARSGHDRVALREALVPVLRSEEFRLRLRRVYAGVAALTTEWIFLALAVWSGSWAESLAGSLLVATSWEVIYHARWIAPDPVLMQFASLTLLCLIVAWKRGGAGAPALAAVAAGFACGTKYPGGLLLLPVLALPWLQPSCAGGGVRVAWRAAGSVGIFLAAYLVTTPGTVLQPLVFNHDLRASWEVYAQGWYGYTVAPGWEHARKLAVYFTTAVFSAWTPLALAGFGLVLVGVWSLVTESRWLAVLVLIFPVVYALYFSQQATMVVRNYLVLVPFAAVLAARGLGWIAGLLPHGPERRVWAALVAGFIAWNAADQVRASATVARRRDTDGFVREFARDAERHPGRSMIVSEGLAAALRRQDSWPKANLRAAGSSPAASAQYASLYSETVGPRYLTWPTNRPGTFAAVFGPRDINLDYYTGWHGGDRVVCLSAERMKELGIEVPGTKDVGAGSPTRPVTPGR